MRDFGAGHRGRRRLIAIVLQGGLSRGKPRRQARGGRSVIVALASPRIATSLEEGLEKVGAALSEASARGAEIVCFPEAYLPGLRGQDFDVLSFDPAEQERALRAVRSGRANTPWRRSSEPRGSRRWAGRSPRMCSMRAARS